MGEDSQSLGTRIFGLGGPKQIEPSAQPINAQPDDPEKHRNLFQKLLGTGKEKPKSPDQPQ